MKCELMKDPSVKGCEGGKGRHGVVKCEGVKSEV